MPVNRSDNLREAETAIVAAFSTGLLEAARSELERIERNWDQDKDALGRSWTPLAESTIRKKGHSRILRESGSMRQSGFVSRSGPNAVTLGIADPKIQIHEWGTEDIPPRKVLGPAKTHLRAGHLRSVLTKRIAKAILALKFGMAIR
ncbi:phage virion morphogenesis protein [Halalkalicoccus jeotgali]|uniref:Phage virion morphogenesis protein n=1 Tax=Halalkalicoccus jeotgali (strain DSM 18796 / CECT 7217 / JCM 14584 / KCTC 4019 / B3) TaxID=795797 RepID=D8J9V5_HALJB|nr:phage virion morphogenesis protein [Halalkalicoccus jeotgali]ADJ14477.1 hypothetical protein HacjB3_05430 [Halalkalicoccus jeotgali B3]ELY40191.1 hypothetical protein C497_03805 [Halalkalicoccus jeotgali B3]